MYKYFFNSHTGLVFSFVREIPFIDSCVTYCLNVKYKPKRNVFIHGIYTIKLQITKFPAMFFSNNRGQ